MVLVLGGAIIAGDPVTGVTMGAGGLLVELDEIVDAANSLGPWPVWTRATPTTANKLNWALA